MVAWKEDVINITLCAKLEQFIHINVEGNHGKVWLITIIYASPNILQRRYLWEHLKLIASDVHIPWLLAGDFNDIAVVNEKKGGAQVSAKKCTTLRNNIEHPSEIAKILEFSWYKCV